MFDQNYFTSVLPEQIARAGSKPVVEVSLLSAARYHTWERQIGDR